MALTKKETKQIPSARDYAVLRQPFITEKASVAGGTGSVIVFRVLDTATKPEIRKAVERIFEVEVSSVRTCNYLGKLKRMNRQVGRQQKFKKAYVTLKEGHTIDLVEGL